ncbi:MAG: stage II sporulation protein D [Parcubacteria group bacterium Gr01-1014_18]|nr:MAG: stage II sporulation protein D [Parcubacteria group bacterium Greene0416_36]TSC81213.1 MAG: stage II sporulation protein D [Parcubacteria group bacterium Gr01-1014_18]TSC99210.1 MAG: stage II sporulation protein D [Parcubacteria group bacterium Greene1014_20]
MFRIFLFLSLLLLPLSILHAEDGYSAELVGKNFQGTLRMKPKAAVTVELRFKNTGNQTWVNSGQPFLQLITAGPDKRASVFRHTFWPRIFSPATLLEKSVKKGETGTFRFAFLAPDTEGDYRESFRGVATKTAWVDGMNIDIPIQVTTLEQSKFLKNTSLSQSVVSSRILAQEPLLRVGLFRSPEPVIIGSDASFSVKDRDGVVLALANGGDKFSIFYDAARKLYIVSGPAAHVETPFSVRLVPDSPESTLVILSKEDRPKWNLKVNYNMYIGVLDLLWDEKKAELWIINEIGMERYLKGLVEVSNNVPIEYLKSMAIAARTYAYYHFSDKTKHSKRGYHIDAYYDQVYKGYQAESYLPRMGQAVDETRGMIVTYSGDIAITPYFTQSDGKTRSWESVWGGKPKPWCVPVADVHNKGKPMLGHGVGMSVQGAYLLAKNDKKTYVEILKHFYTGVEIERFY